MASIQPATGVLGKKHAAHLLRRTNFGPTLSEINDFASQTVGAAVNAIVQPVTPPEPPLDPTTSQTWIGQPGTDDFNEDAHKVYFLGWWLDQMKNAGGSVIEKMVYFYHTHFTTIQSRIPHSEALYHQNAIFRYYALGNFKELSKKMCIDNAMLRHLDGFINVVGNPNENFGREYLELFTIGKGPQTGAGDYSNYNEDDVQAAAKLLSGFGYDDTFSNIDPDCGIPIGVVKSGDGVYASQHDATTKTFSDAFQGTAITPLEVVGGRATIEATLQELDEFVEMIFGQEETARHICRKLYRFFVYYKITDEVENDIIVPLANTFRDNNYEIEPVLRQLFQSEHFYDMDDSEERDDHFGAIIKSPVELLIHTIRFFEMPVPASPAEMYAFYGRVLRIMEDQGLNLYEPYEVAGYPAYHQTPAYNRNWISSNYLALRYQFISEFINGVGDMDMPLSKIDIVSFIEGSVADPADPNQIVALLTENLFPQPISTERFDYFKNVALLDNLSELNWSMEWNSYKSSGDDSAVRSQLELLLTAIVQSPEYQLC